MEPIKFDINLIKVMSLFETVTRVQPKDCIDMGTQVLFIVQEKDIAKAIGQKGVHVKKLEHILKRNIKIVPFKETVISFIVHLLHPLQVREAREEQGVITLIPQDMKTRGMIIGRGATHLRSLEAIVKRYYAIKEIKVI
ncbi:NusA-like transcription termination signal-binding factor [Candidatus Woesearchaeota archaeon]|nr:NusA-like transcription termination signal-binding factor [Candidatus Woesearchaeota archaeon]